MRYRRAVQTACYAYRLLESSPLPQIGCCVDHHLRSSPDAELEYSGARMLARLLFSSRAVLLLLRSLQLRI